MAFYEVDDIFFRYLLSVYPYPFAEVDQVRRGVKPDLISRLAQDRDTRRSKGFAFVEMPEDSEAQNAIRDLNGATYEGRQMVVKEAIPRR